MLGWAGPAVRYQPAPPAVGCGRHSLSPAGRGDGRRQGRGGVVVDTCRMRLNIAPAEITTVRLGHRYRGP